jgi:hypothetical protein
MLAYLIDEQAMVCEEAGREVALVVPAPDDDQGVWAHVAYEAAQQLEGRCWIPARRRRADACRCESAYSAASPPR